MKLKCLVVAPLLLFMSEVIAAGPLNVVATTPQIGDAVQNVGGALVSVKVLVAPGTDPHSYKATPTDAVALRSAQLIFYSGLALESQMQRVLDFQGKSKPVVAVSSELSKDLLLPDPDLAGHFDPHFWHDPTMWQQAVKTVISALTKADKINAITYETKGEAYLKTLQKLESDLKLEFDRIAPESRTLVTIHDAFRYFARRFGFHLENIQGVNTESAASVAAMRRVTDFLVSRKIPAMFLENSTPSRNAQAVIDGSRAKGWRVVLAGSLYADGPGPKGLPAGTYEGMMRENAKTIVSALAPQKN